MIKSHIELRDAIQGHRILHLNSLGKDSAVTLHWLVTFARVEVVSVFFKRLAFHPDDDRYFNYQKRSYPNVKFIEQPNGNELTDFPAGIYQDPIRQITDHNTWEYIAFSMQQQADELARNEGCSFVCSGFSGYESVSRAVKFQKLGLMQHPKDREVPRIFPIGLWKKEQVLNTIRGCNIKLHPCYKLHSSTLDHVSYYKMRATFVARPEYYERVRSLYPLIELDKFRWEKLL